ncbi:MAG: 16S rRNA (guanine(966)-N(2))-methyltransferase RsmD [Halioglobus sp.]|nr:16S rRNA (guanine(966)-N(2))-methyltransferase RsmD [Halioglobus sp.]
MARPGKHTRMQQQVRIIGGQWRGRKLSFTPAEGLRPTGDRIKETLFNWLAPDIQGARCVDLFAGSGALGLEALSRGASSCDFIDSSKPTLAQVNDHLKTLAATDRGRCQSVSAQQFLKVTTQPYDIVFIDPPFSKQLVGPIFVSLAHKQLLRDSALVYVELGAMEPLPTVPQGWSLHREKVTGGVAFRLFRVQ